MVTDEAVSRIHGWSLSPRMEGHKIVALGHSAGAAAVLLTTKGLSMDTNPYRAIILIEPTVVNREVFQTSIEERLAEMEFVVSATSSRKDNWRSKEAAFEYFQKRLPWKFWDKRVVRLLSEYGLDDSPGKGVILKCDKRHEALSYPDVEPHFEAAIQIANVGRLVPIHLIWGTRNELVPEYFQEALCDASAGRIIASVTKVKGGHFLVQERPDEVADVIAGILDGLPGKSAGQVPLSKL
ncbi:hypothetical protein D9613_004588 [Agrocybe pediades]|uniref:AB hydrolase-1 domain-containing protein n=1 Tax=Agrocybe pediades TaxID=84607 RepID=A0A8H4QJI1_9AGAR|nr:hypothetical protein D9613_004588 [Agrocybe pediades]